MALNTQEKTSRQWSWFGWLGAGYSWLTGSNQVVAPLIKAQHGSGALEGKNEYDVPCIPGQSTLGVAGGVIGQPNGRPWPGTLATYRVMAGHPTIALAEAAVVLAILAAEWSVELDEGLADDAEAQRAKRILELELVKRRPVLMRGLLRMIRYGWKSLETVYDRKTDEPFAPAQDDSGDGKKAATVFAGEYVGVRKFKELVGEAVDVNLDDRGNLLGIISAGATVEPPYFLHVLYDKEDDNWFGRSRYENIRRTWANYLYFEDRLKKLLDKGTGTTPRVGVPPDSDADVKAGKTPNLTAGLLLANKIADNAPSAFYNLVGVSASDFVNNAELAGKSNVSVEMVETGNPGPTVDAITAHLAYLDKMLVRGLLQPERTLIEASTAGSRADSESHGDLATADAEATHELIVEQVNEQAVQPLILENCGAKYAGRIRLVAVPLQDEQRAQLGKLFDGLLTDPAYRAKLCKAMGDEGMRGLIDRLGLNITLEEDFDFSDPEPVTGAVGPDGKPVPPKHVADDVSLSLSRMAELLGRFEKARA